MSDVETTPTGAKESVVVIGLGYVGLPLAVLISERGYPVRGFDTDTRKIRLLKQKEAPFLSEAEQTAFTGSTLEATSDARDIMGAGIYVICVPTPVHGNRKPDLRPLRSAAKTVGRSIGRGALVIIESTVSPGVCENAALPLLEKHSGLKVGVDFSFAHCPERINPGDERWDTRTIPRVVGGYDERSLTRALQFYQSITDAELTPMGSIKEAEAVKMVENAFRDINIAFVNELAMSFSKADIDIHNVLDGASTKPFAFIRHSPGCGVGGHCIPVDPYYLIRYGRENGFEHHFLATARRINSGMPRFTVELLAKALKETGKTLNGARIALLGLSYKKDIPDMRESPALVINEELEKAGADVRVFDPLVQSEGMVGTLDEALDGADAALIATDHTEFTTLQPEDFLMHGVDVVVDGRNCLPKEAFLTQGLIYRGIGR